MAHTDLVLSAWRQLDSLLGDEESDLISLTGHDLTISQVVLISRHRRRAIISDSALKSLERSLATLENGLKDGHIIYGVNTGFGGSADIRTNKVAELQQALIRELHYGILPPSGRDHHVAVQDSHASSHRHDLQLDNNCETLYVPWSWARAAIAIRINSLITGVSAVRPVIVERMLDLLQHDIIPMIPLRGSISASGDLSPLSYICGAIQGKSTIRVLSKSLDSQYADVALAKAGLEPVRMQAKEGLAMTNGTAVSAAAAALALHDTQGLAIMAQVLTAMSVEAMNGTTESFRSFFSEVRPHPGQIESARNIWEFLVGSKLTKVNDGANSALRQDRYSIRTAPQWLGPILEDLTLANQQITIECNSVTDNPLVTSEGEFLHGGNFQAKAVTSAMEKARQATQGIGRMLFSQCTELINPATNRGLPPNLIAEDPSVSLIFKGTDLNIASLTAELGFLANPVNHVQTAEMGNQSLNSLALISARYTHTANEVLSQLIAAHLITVCQALDLRAMQIRFLELYRPEFEELVSRHYPEASSAQPTGLISTTSRVRSDEEQPPAKRVKVQRDGEAQQTNPTSTAPPEILANGISQHVNEPSSLATIETPTHPTATPSSNNGLTTALWTQLLIAFDTTAGLDASERSHAIARSLRPAILDTSILTKTITSDFTSRLEDFTAALSLSIHETWCANRDSYLAHGDASHLLGRGSKVLYEFVRKDLSVPLLATDRLRTPASAELVDGDARAPTVGSFTGAVYRALRDGSLMKVAVDLLRDCQGDGVKS